MLVIKLSSLPPLSQPTPANFPGENPDLSSKDFAIPQSSWLGLYPRGLSKLLALPLWLCMQYLGKEEKEMMGVDYKGM